MSPILATSASIKTAPCQRQYWNQGITNTDLRSYCYTTYIHKINLASSWQTNVAQQIRLEWKTHWKYVISKYLVWILFGMNCASWVRFIVLILSANDRAQTVSLRDLSKSHSTFTLQFHEILLLRGGVTVSRLGLVIGFIEPLQIVTSNKDYALNLLYTFQITTGHARSPQSITVFTSLCLVAASNDGRFLSCGVLKFPRPQLPASNNTVHNDWTPAVIWL
jgi:hypothetical protein